MFCSMAPTRGGGFILIYTVDRGVPLAVFHNEQIDRIISNLQEWHLKRNRHDGSTWGNRQIMIDCFGNIRRTQHAIVLSRIGLEGHLQLHRARYRCTNLERQLRIQHIKGIVLAVDVLAENKIVIFTINDLCIDETNCDTC